jgi:hypothetical protein
MARTGGFSTWPVAVGVFVRKRGRSNPGCCRQRGRGIVIRSGLSAATLQQNPVSLGSFSGWIASQGVRL